MIPSHVPTALLLTCLGALGTCLGGAIVVVQPKISFKRLGYLQGLAAGLMLSISMMDLYPEAEEAIGFGLANLCFFAGILFAGVVVAYIPEPPNSMVHVDEEEDDDSHVDAVATSTLAPSPQLRQRKPQLGVQGGTAGAVSGAGSSAARRAAKKRVLMSGLITAAGIALHNFPEGVAVFLAAMKSPAVGASLAFAIALHNIPEGVAVSLPVYFATGSRMTGLMYAFVSGLAEPLAVVVLAIFFPSNINERVVDCLLAAVGGVMAFLAVQELLPSAMEHGGRTRAVQFFFLGMAIMSANLYFLHDVLQVEH